MKSQYKKLMENSQQKCRTTVDADSSRIKARITPKLKSLTNWEPDKEMKWVLEEQNYRYYVYPYHYLQNQGLQKLLEDC